jgi:hypothetical protein
VTDEPKVEFIHADYKLDTGNVLQLYEPENSARGPMKDGRCPGCQNGLLGYVGRCACVRELVEGDLLRPVWGEYSTNYGHYACIEDLWLKIVQRLDAPETHPPVRFWKVGTQRQMVDFVMRAGADGKDVVVSYDQLAGRDRRYQFHTNDREPE